MVDPSRAPEIEYDDSTEEGSVTLTWWSEDRRSIFSVILRDGVVRGVTSAMDPSQWRPQWKVELPKGLVKIDATAPARDVQEVDPLEREAMRLQR